MKIVEIELRGFKPFKFNDVSRLQITNIDSILCVIGSNGCLSGDTLVTFGQNFNGIKNNGWCRVSIENAFNNRNIYRNASVRSHTGKTIQFHEIEDIVYSGIKDVYKVTLSNGKYIKCTIDHEIMTLKGFIVAGNVVGQFVMCDGVSKQFDYVHYVEAVSIEYMGKEKTYDIVCKDPHRNFVANGIVVHNSGKSSLLRECTPLPSVRSDYDADGYKRILIHHNGSEFIISSDFSNRVSPHSFIRDTVELNISGTTTVQIDLVREHLEYTQDVSDILTGTVQFSDMSPGLRKTLLLNNNPFQLGFILEKHKAAYTRVRAYQNNLTRLYERKTALESEFLDASLEDQLLKEQTVLTEELSQVIEYVHRISEHIQNLERSSHTKYQSINVDTIRSDIKSILRNAYLYKDVPRTNLNAYMTQLQKTITEQTILYNTISDQIQTLLQDIDRYNRHIQEDNHKEIAKDLKKTIDDYKYEIGELETKLISNPYDDILMDDIPNHISKLNTILNIFVGCDQNLESPTKTQKRKLRYEKYQRLYSSYYEKYSQSKLQLDRLENRLHQWGPDPSCVSTTCPLLLEFKKSLETLKLDQQRYAEDVRHFTHKVKRYNLIIEKLGDKLSTLEKYRPYLEDLSEYLGTYGHLRIPIRSIDILHILKTQPFMITRLIEEHYNGSVAFYRQRILQKELDTVMTKYTQITTSESIDHQFIHKIISEKRQEFDTLREKLEHLETSLEMYQKTIQLSVDYQGCLERLSYHKETLLDYEYQETVKNDMTVFKSLKAFLEQQKITTALRLNEITQILRNQETLKIRYDEEVVKQIQQLEQDKHKMSLIEKALSPNSGIPHRYTVHFLNVILQNMNYFINRVFNYPFELVQVSNDDNLTYRFPVVVGDDVNVPDLSSCSSAQKKIIDLAFMWSMIVQLKLTDYGICLDEPDSPFDHLHKQRLIEMLKAMIDENIVSQLFIISHHVILHDGIFDADIVVLNDQNIMLPSVYNVSVELEH